LAHSTVLHQIPLSYASFLHILTFGSNDESVLSMPVRTSLIIQKYIFFCILYLFYSSTFSCFTYKTVLTYSNSEFNSAVINTY
jgi:hypothetical protein